MYKFYIKGVPGKSEDIYEFLIKSGGTLRSEIEDHKIFEDPDYIFYLDKYGYIRGTSNPGLIKIFKTNSKEVTLDDE